MSVRGAILAEIFTRLSALPGLGSIEMMPDSDPDAYPAIRIFDDGHQPVEGEAMATRYELAASIELHVQGGDPTTIHARLSDLHATAVASLMTEPPLGGLAEQIEDADFRIQVDELSDTKRLKAAQDFKITFATRRGNPAQPA